jgi:transcriptional regulator with XRE-family HTH domain
MARNERFRAARLARGLSQRKLAKRLGCARSSIYRLEAGMSAARKKFKKRIARLLAKPTWLLFEG